MREWTLKNIEPTVRELYERKTFF